jgi:hypothetical protein
MKKKNCWEVRNCGREVDGKNSERDGVCPAATFDLADGFCDGVNGGRACSYIMGTLCSADLCKIDEDFSKERACAECDFYKELKAEHGTEMSLMAFHDFVDKKKDLAQKKAEKSQENPTEELAKM